MRAEIVAAILVGTAASAQEVSYSHDASDACMAQAQTPEAKKLCIGASAEACMENSEEGFTTIGTMECIDNERTYWDGLLNQTYKQLRSKAKSQDAELDGIGSSAPRIAPTLRDMQRAWITYRDTTCDFEQSQWGGGSGGGPAVLSCLLHMTGEQAIYLESAWFGE